jgi:hypothetical protein
MDGRVSGLFVCLLAIGQATPAQAEEFPSQPSFFTNLATVPPAMIFTFSLPEA